MSFRQREVTTRHIEFLVPTGSNAKDFDMAWLAARDRWQGLNPPRADRPGYAAPPDDWATVIATDDYVIIRITVTDVEVTS